MHNHISFQRIRSARNINYILIQHRFAHITQLTIVIPNDKTNANINIAVMTTNNTPVNILQTAKAAKLSRNHKILSLHKLKK